MKIPTNPIETAALQDPDMVRYPIQHVFLDAERLCLVATDGHMIVISPVELDSEDKTSLIPAGALKAARNPGEKIQSVEMRARPEGVTLTVTYKHSQRNPEVRVFTVENGECACQFPKYEATVPKLKGPPTMVLDAALLARLLEALKETGTEAVCQAVAFWAPKTDKDPVIIARLGSRSFAGLMQMRAEFCGKDLQKWFWDGRPAPAKKG